MAEQEYFVRNPDSENARGPFTLDKLLSLVEAGQVDRQSLIYDDAGEVWTPLGENPELCSRLFPEKKKLTLRRRSDAAQEPEAAPQTDAKPEAAPAKPAAKKTPAPSAAPEKPDEPEEEPDPAKASSQTARVDKSAEKKPEKEAEKEKAPRQLSGMNVEDLLEAAEGKTEHMEQIRDEKMWIERAIAMSLPILTVLMLLSAVSILAAQRSELWALLQKGFGMHWLPIFEQPRVVLGAVDLLLGLLLALAVTRIYPLLRFRLMLGLGYMGYLAYAAWLAGSHAGAVELLALVMFSAGVFVCTLTLRLWLLLAGGLCALAGVVILGLLWNFPGVLS